MNTELKESLDRAAEAVQHVHGNFDVRLTLLALIDALVEIAAALPEPHTVPKE